MPERDWFIAADTRPPEPLPERTARQVDKGHGRVEVRTARTTSLLTLGRKWPGLKPGVELRRVKV